MTPATVHYGLAEQLTRQRQAVLQAAYEKHPERFVKGKPTPPKLPEAVWINPPLEKGREEPSSKWLWVSDKLVVCGEFSIYPPAMLASEELLTNLSVLVSQN